MYLIDYFSCLNGRDKKENKNSDEESYLSTVSREIEERLEKL